MLIFCSLQNLKSDFTFLKATLLTLFSEMKNKGKNRANP